MTFDWLKDPQWIIAIATFIAVLVALFKDWISDGINKPKIILGLRNKEPHIVWDYSYGTIKKLFRIKIINKGNTVAKNCYVKVLSVFPQPKEKFFEPDKLKWSSAPLNMEYRYESLHNQDISQLVPIHREHIDISPKGGWEFCDLFNCILGDDHINFVSSGMRRFLAWEKTYFVTIEICGENIKPKKATFKISYFHDTHKTRIDWVKNISQ
ncbi:MAG TPA: hypothetical protein VJB35_01085 [Candidatus Nanoarchaeia archaeon]|nr:hypothetical protein [Candidatus Nanoarchaeia archaeon]